MGFFQAVARVPGDFARDLRMNRTQALIFLTSWFCWTIGSMHYFMLSYTMPEIAKTLGVEQSKIAQANTTSMLSRALGAVIFGVLSDQFGRKIPLLIDLVLMGVFTLCTGFIHTYGQLIGVRFLFGWLMPLFSFVLKKTRLTIQASLMAVFMVPRWPVCSRLCRVARVVLSPASRSRASVPVTCLPRVLTLP